MHEVSVATSLVQTAADHVPPGKYLQNVYVTIGPLSGVSAEALEFCFTAVAQEMGHGSARLVMTLIPAGFECLACHERYESSSVYSSCPSCNSFERNTLSGDRFSLDAIDVEDIDHV